MAYTRPNNEHKKKADYSIQLTDVNRHISVNRTYKNYIGGKQSRPDGGYTKHIMDPSNVATYDIPISNRKDLRNAVEAANKASGWSSSTGHLRAQILYYFAENLSARADEFATLIDVFKPNGISGANEVQATLETIFECAAWSDKFDGDVRNVPMRGLALSLNEPVGTICAFAPSEHALTGFGAHDCIKHCSWKPSDHFPIRGQPSHCR